MKKLLVVSMAVLLATLLIVSCSQDAKSVEDKVAIISFDTTERLARSLTRTSPVLDADSLYWYYTAEKKDSTGLITGETKDAQGNLTKTAVDSGNKGLAQKVGPFSYGDWEFTLYGCAKSEGTEVAYKGTATITINKATTTLPVTVASQSTGANGTLEIPKKGDIKLKMKNGNEVSAYTNVVEKVYITKADGTAISNPTTYIESTTDVTNITLPSDNYKVTISFQDKKDDAATETDKVNIYAEETIYVTIVDYQTTKIGGDIAESTQSGTFSPTDGSTYTNPTTGENT